MLHERHWKYYPALKLALPFAAGIALSNLLAPTAGQLLVLLYGALGWLLLALIRREVDAGLALLLVLALAGGLAWATRGFGGNDPVGGRTVQGSELVGRVAGDPVFRHGRVEFPVRIDSLLYRNSVAHPEGIALVRLYDTTPHNPRLLPRQGDRIAIAGTATFPAPPANPGGFDYAAYLRAHGVVLLLNAGRASSVYIYERDVLPWDEMLVLPVRRAARSFADRQVQGEEGDIVRALLLGEREYIDPETRDAFMRTGTVHLLSVSGLHVGVIAMVLFVAVSWINRRWIQLLLFLLLLGFYTIAAGADPPIVRASLMAGAFMIARVSGRIPRPLNVLGFAALAILLFRPEQLFDVGFQLSFASVLGIILFYTPAWRAIAGRWPRTAKHLLVRLLLQGVLLSVSAQLCTLPLVLYHFGTISLIGLAVNIPVIPLFSVALGASLAGAVADPIIPLVGRWLGGSAWLSLHAAGELVRWGAGVGSGMVETGSIGTAGASFLGLVILYLSLSRGARQAAWRTVAVSLAVATVLLAARLLDPLGPDGAGNLYLLSMRQGMAVAALQGDTLMVYARGSEADSGRSAMFAGEGLRRRIGAVGVRVVPIGSAAADTITHDALLLNSAPRELALRGYPVILSNTAQRPLGLVRSDTNLLLQVPLRQRLEESVVVRYEGGWRIIPWG